MRINRGDIWWANLGKPECKTNIQKGIRPVIIVSNKMCNNYSPVITIIPVTSNRNKNKIPTHVKIPTSTGINKESIALAEQLMPLDKHDLISRIGHCNDNIINHINKAILIQNGININNKNYSQMAN